MTESVRRTSKTVKSTGPVTLALDVGGSDLKALLLDATGKALGKALKHPTPGPAQPVAVMKVLEQLARQLGPADRCSVGFPGVVRGGRVGTAVNLTPRWVGMDLQQAMQRRLGIPVRVANDADVQGLGAIRGNGVELVTTLGTGFGSGLFVDGVLVPNLELGHCPFRDGKTFEQLLGNKNLKTIGVARWNRLLRKAIDQLRVVFNFRRLYLGGGNARLVNFSRPRDVSVVSNRAGLLGGIRLWDRQEVS